MQTASAKRPGRMPIQLPANNWFPREYQQPLWSYLEGGGKRAAVFWHRRAGKDACCLHWAAVAAHQRKGNYWHMLPEYAQARKAIWTAVNPITGVRIIDECFPKQVRKTTREDQMFIEFLNGSSWQVLGSDRYDSLVGSPPVGVVFSEWALANPAAWDYIRPILADNDGWALFITTPRGRNHALKLLELARSNSDWFAEVLTVDQTRAISQKVLEGERRELMALWGEDEGERLFDQEYNCSFTSPVRGSYYGKVLARIEGAGHIRNLPYDSRYPVVTAWDLGIGDATAIWFVQTIASEVRVIDFYQATGQGLDHYAKILRMKPYSYLEHLLPHDAEARELGTGKTRQETLKRLDIGRIRVIPQQRVDDGINAVRTLLEHCYFDQVKCEKGLDALRSYHCDFDERNNTIRRTPVHDWASHPADAFRYLALGLRTFTPASHVGLAGYSGPVQRPRSYSTD
jgi:phage terminase large subunit